MKIQKVKRVETTRANSKDPGNPTQESAADRGSRNQIEQLRQMKVDENVTAARRADIDAQIHFHLEEREMRGGGNGQQ